MNACRVCHSPCVYRFLPLGHHPPANQFLPVAALTQPEFTAPLDAYVCLECGLIQVADHIPPDFFRHYVYVPSVSDTLQRHFAAFARTLYERLVRPNDGLVVDIGSNDGLFLSACRGLGLRTLGVEPAANLTEIARSKGVEVLNDYFSPATARTARDRYGPAAVIVTTNTFNHIDSLHDFVHGVRLLLEDGGTFIIEVPQAVDLVERNEFDTIYHEHLSEFSVKSLMDLFRFFDMEIYGLESLDIHGGSMRVFAQRRGGLHAVSPMVEEWLARERAAGLFTQATYDAFRERVVGLRAELLALLRRLKAEGKRLAGYGAPAKGNTLLNYCGIGPDLLDFLADRNQLKQGLYSPGMHIPVVPTERIAEARPDYLLILAWNFADEIVAQQAAFRAAGGRFILAIPEPKIL